VITLKEYQHRAQQTCVVPADRPLGDVAGTAYPMLGLVEEIGEIAGKLKRVVREGGGIITPEVRADLTREIGDALWYLGRLSGILGISLQVAAEENLKKVEDRFARGVVKGEGDNR